MNARLAALLSSIPLIGSHLDTGDFGFNIPRRPRVPRDNRPDHFRALSRKPVETRQVVRAELRASHFARLNPTDNPFALGVPVRKERRKLARAYAAGEWKQRRAS